jgi:hypothetical protein
MELLRYLALALSFLMVSGCTFLYSGRPVPVPKIETMPVSRTEGPVTIGVDPYIQPERQKEVFDDDLKKAGVLPIYLLIKNNGERPISFRRRSEMPLADIALELPDGMQISPIQTDTVLRQLGGDRFARMLDKMRFGLPQDERSKHERSKDIAMAFLLFPLIPIFLPGMVGIEVENSAIEARINDYMKKEFKDVKLNKDESTHGFVYFMPSSTPWAMKGKLLLRFEDTDGTDFVVRVPVIEQ